MPVSYFSQNAAHTSCMLSLQGVLLCTAALSQPDTESLFPPVDVAGEQKCRGWQYIRLQAAILSPMRKKHQEFF